MARGRLAPGFRFHPTDEELVRFYLRRKVINKPFRLDPISVVDVYKFEPWDLPDKSKLKTRDLEWYFFSMLDKKYSNGSKTNRATEKGYWKTTGKDRPIKWNSRIVGMKKTLVFHKGRAPRGERSNWVMHEYRLIDEELETSGVAQDAFVLCRIFQKSGTGPKNGEKYGAPLIEEEWDESEEIGLVPELMVANDLSWPDDEFFETSDLLQSIDPHASTHLNGFHDDSGNSVDLPRNTFEAAITKPHTYQLKYRDNGVPESSYNLLDYSGQELTNSESMYDSLGIEKEKMCIRKSSSYPVVPFLDSSSNHYEENLFVDETDDFGWANQENLDDPGFDIEEFLNFLDAEDKNPTFDPSEPVTDPSTSDPVIKEETEEPISYDPDKKPSFLKKASHLLDSIPAPPACASEFPIKNSARLLQPGQSSTTIHLTAGLIRIEESSSSVFDWPSDKTRTMLIETSYYPLEKSESLTFLHCFFLIMFWVLVYSVSYRITSDVTAK